MALYHLSTHIHGTMTLYFVQVSWILRLETIKVQNLVKKSPFLRTYREILEIDHVSDSAAPPKSKTMPEMKYLDTKASQENFDFFPKNIFSQYFPKISTSQNPKFRDLADPAKMCPEGDL